MHKCQILSAMCILFIFHKNNMPGAFSWAGVLLKNPQNSSDQWTDNSDQDDLTSPSPPTWMDARKRLPTVRLKVWPTCYTCCSTCLALRLIYNEKKSHPCLERLIYRLSSWAKSWVPTFDDNRTPNDDSLDNDNDSNNDFIIIVNMYIS